MIRTCISIVGYNIKKWKNNYYMLFGLVYLLLISDMMFRPVRNLVQILEIAPSVSAFALIWNSRFFLMLFFFGVVLFYSDAPFQDSMSTFTMIRCGKMRFMAAQISYIFLLGILIPVLFFLIQFFSLMPSGEGGWGKFWGTLAQTNVAIQSGCDFHFQYHILWDFEPEEAFLITFSLCILLTTMTGLFLYLCSLFRMKTVGICILSVFIILPVIVDWLNFTTFNWLSPYSWICLDTTMRDYNGSLPSLSYVFSALGIIHVVLLVFIVLKTKKGKESLI